MFLLRRLFLLYSLAAFIFLIHLGYGDTDPSEVHALQQIAMTLGQNNWNFSADPCSGLFISNSTEKNKVDCSCPGNGTVCHITGIILREQNLNGTLPKEVVNLRSLEEIDLSFDNLSGSIPPEWGSSTLLHLRKLNLTGNRLTGPIPGQLGNLGSLQELILDSNYLSGKLPETLAALTKLTDFEIRDNQFEGSIPNFIQNWTYLKKLVMQASGLNGPIPSGIASLTNLTTLILSDLNGNQSTSFPPLSNAIHLEILILRSCNIIDQIPDYIRKLTNLTHLDLSFNNLTGSIPGTKMSNARYIYLTRNSLSGTLPDWVLHSKQFIDLSYNSFTYQRDACDNTNLNLFASFSDVKTRDICPNTTSLKHKYYSLYINCGGGSGPNHNYQDDDDDEYTGLPSSFYQSTRAAWFASSTGNFLYDVNTKPYTFQNSMPLNSNNPDLCKDARLSPLSLTYYGYRLKKGNYTVKLHFAEIMFTNDGISSLARRLFDIYIQDQLVKKDFNIEEEAGGVNIEITKNFTAQVNSDGTLAIRFYWAGKGTMGIPDSRAYGPLVSAISVDPDFTPPSGNISAGAVVGIVITVMFTISLVICILWWKGCLRQKSFMDEDLRGLELVTGSFTLRQIRAATNSFDAANKIGEGGFGPVYKGLLSDGTMIAVKKLSNRSNQGNREFVNEIGMVSALQHPHLVKLYGCCVEGNQLLLVYEYMENNSLARALFGQEEYQLQLDWPTRHRICVGIARGLAYLHEESRLKIVHRDIKATNVLLDKNLNPKISDFGLAKLDEEDTTHISTRIAGTYGYMAPEYAMRGYLTDKADVYSFGIVLLEIVSGRSNSSIKPKEDCFHLLDWAHELKEKGNLMGLVDLRLGSKFDKGEVMMTIDIAFLCTNVSPAARPSMSSVVRMLEGRTLVEELNSESKGLIDKMKADEIIYRPKQTSFTHSQVQSSSTDFPLTASSTSPDDLYPINLNTDFWERRL